MRNQNSNLIQELADLHWQLILNSNVSKRIIKLKFLNNPRHPVKNRDKNHQLKQLKNILLK